MFKLEDIKAGMMVVVKYDGTDRNALVMPKKDGKLCLTCEDYWNDLDSFDDNTLDYYGTEIMKIYDICSTNKHAWDTKDTDHRALLWERVKPKEMTVNEIEAILGYKIKIIGGNE